MAYITVPIETDSDALAQDAFDYLEAKTNGVWAPHDGQLDTWQLEANARMAATLRDLASDVPDSIFRYFGVLVGIPPFDAVAASVVITIPITNTTGNTIPAGSHWGYTDQFGSVFEFVTPIDVVVDPSVTTIDVTVVATTEGLAFSGLGGPGATMDMIDQLAWIGPTATMASATSGGIDAEDDAAYLSRLTANLQMPRRPVLPADFEVVAKNTAGVARALALDGFDNTIASSTNLTGTLNGTTTVSALGAGYAGVTVGALVSGTGIQPQTFVQSMNTGAGTLVLTKTAIISGSSVLTFENGYGNARMVTVALADINGDPVTSIAQSDVLASLTNSREVTFIIYVIDPTYTTIDVQFDINAWPNADSTALNASVVSAVQAFLSPATWGNPPFGDQNIWYNTPKIMINDVMGVIKTVDGVRDVNSVTMRKSTNPYAASDIVMTGPAPLPRSGAVAGTVR